MQQTRITNTIARLPATLLLGVILVLAGSGCLGTRMVFSGIEGPDRINENSWGTFNVHVTGERPESYDWAVDPSTAGTFAQGVGPVGTFTAGEVADDTEIRIRVTIKSPHDGPYVLGKVVIIVDTGQGPVAAAHADRTSIEAGEIVQFFDDSTDPDGDEDIVSWEWDFSFDSGEGFNTESTERNPSYVYMDAGVFEVQLIVTDTAGLTDMLDEPLVIQVGQGQQLTIAAVNHSRTTSRAGDPDEAVELSVEFDDPAPSPDTLTYSWGCPFGSFDDPASATPIWFPPDQVVKCDISVEVTDDLGNSDTGTVHQWVTDLDMVENPYSPHERIPSQTLDTIYSGPIDPAGFVFPDTMPDGNVVYVNYWATWCGYCIAEMPDLQEMYELYRDQEFIYLLVNLGESGSVVENFINSHSFDPTYWALDPDSTYFNVLREWNGNSTAIPQHWVFDRDGHCRWAHVGALISLGTDELEAAIEQLL